MSEHSTFDICVEPIELCKLLKIANMVGGGGEAKTMISEGNVIYVYGNAGELAAYEITAKN